MKSPLFFAKKKIFFFRLQLLLYFYLVPGVGLVQPANPVGQPVSIDLPCSQEQRALKGQSYKI